MTNLSYGSRGDDVASLQKQLNAAGYNLAVDGIYGAATAAAVRDYQSRNALAADGVVGPQTMNSLFERGGGVAHYESPVGGRMATLYETMTNRPVFTYDPENDAVYRYYRRQYTTAAAQARDDTLGRTAALTGGYASTYGQSAAQQNYLNYINKLWGVLPTLYQQAYNRYRNEGSDLRAEYSALLAADKEAYRQYQDYVKQYQAAQKAAAAAAKNAAKTGKATARTTKAATVSRRGGNAVAMTV